MYFKIKVKFGRDFIQENDGGFIVGLKSLPEKGKANQTLIKKLAKHFKADIFRVKIVSGLTSKNKVVEIKPRT